MRRSTMRYSGSVVMLVLALAACSGSTEPNEPAPPPVTTTEAPDDPSDTVLRGTVQAGVESGCLILSTGQGQFLLLGGDREVFCEGANVVVEGVPRPDQATTCQQGTPFAVSDARVEENQ